ncbi:MAG: hypothetical protein D6731_24345 [Planctomycetota bacterium]|nr:MAG: hypothetical protein D6731_24345 [Planctomycetota bacterium]
MPTPSLPRFRFGERFRVRSQSGKDYTARYLAVGEKESGLFVRLDSGELARLELRRLRWSTLERLESLPGQSTVREGDDVLVECSAGKLRGKLASGLGESMLRLENGLCVDTREVYALHLLFRAPSLRAGDRFFVRSLSGRNYEGLCLSAGGEEAHARLDSREEVRLRLASLDADTLYVAVPVPRNAYRGYGGETR